MGDRLNTIQFQKKSIFESSEVWASIIQATDDRTRAMCARVNRLANQTVYHETMKSSFSLMERITRWLPDIVETIGSLVQSPYAPHSDKREGDLLPQETCRQVRSKFDSLQRLLGTISKPEKYHVLFPSYKEVVNEYITAIGHILIPLDEKVFEVLIPLVHETIGSFLQAERPLTFLRQRIESVVKLAHLAKVTLEDESSDTLIDLANAYGCTKEVLSWFPWKEGALPYSGIVFSLLREGYWEEACQRVRDGHEKMDVHVLALEFGRSGKYEESLSLLRECFSDDDEEEIKKSLLKGLIRGGHSEKGFQVIQESEYTIGKDSFAELAEALLLCGEIDLAIPLLSHMDSILVLVMRLAHVGRIDLVERVLQEKPHDEKYDAIMKVVKGIMQVRDGMVEGGILLLRDFCAYPEEEAAHQLLMVGRGIEAEELAHRTQNHHIFREIAMEEIKRGDLHKAQCTLREGLRYGKPSVF